MRLPNWPNTLVIVKLASNNFEFVANKLNCKFLKLNLFVMIFFSSYMYPKQLSYTGYLYSILLNTHKRDKWKLKFCQKYCSMKTEKVTLASVFGLFGFGNFYLFLWSLPVLYALLTPDMLMSNVLFHFTAGDEYSMTQIARI